MADALTSLLAVAAIVVCAAAVAKLRSPHEAVSALADLGVPASTVLVRALAVTELATGAWCLVRPDTVGAGLLAGLYAGFAVVSLRLAGRRSGCGCFGEREAPASALQSVLSTTSAAVAIAASVWGAHGVSWLLGRPPAAAAVLCVGVAGAAYGTVLVYTQLPVAWSAWARGST